MLLLLLLLLSFYILMPVFLLSQLHAYRNRYVLCNWHVHTKIICSLVYVTVFFLQILFLSELQVCSVLLAEKYDILYLFRPGTTESVMHGQWCAKHMFEK